LRVFSAGVLPGDVAPPPQIRNRVFVTQELPSHPRSQLFSGVVMFGRQPVRDTILTRQELPPHPGSRFIAGVQGPNVAPNPMIRNRVHVTQELPWHPRSVLWSAPPPVRAQVPFQRPIIVTQERPSHPPSVMRAGTPPTSYEDVEFFVMV
jgi:hypothetical protein